MGNYTYLALDLLSIAFPLLASFEPRIAFWRKWHALLPGIMVMALVFIPWDIAFTAQGSWGFNDRYLLGARVAGLPLEEWLFFLMIPYACMFLYEVMRHFVKRNVLGKAARPVAMILAVLLAIIGLLHIDHAYTAITFLGTALYLALHVLLWKSAWLGRFFIGYGISLIPFFLVNGLLTGTWLEEPVVWYNDLENLGVRMGTIPVEDSIYLLWMLLIVTHVYETRLKRDHGEP